MQGAVPFNLVLHFIRSFERCSSQSSGDSSSFFIFFFEKVCQYFFRQIADSPRLMEWEMASCGQWNTVRHLKEYKFSFSEKREVENNTSHGHSWERRVRSGFLQDRQPLDVTILKSNILRLPGMWSLRLLLCSKGWWSICLASYDTSSCMNDLATPALREARTLFVRL